MTKLTLSAVDQSTYVVRCAFTDEDGVAAIPTEISWTLTDGAGEVVNSQEAVDIETPAATVDIYLSGLDLAPTGGTAVRILTVEATYTSTVGDDLPLKAACRFLVEDLIAVPVADPPVVP